MAGGPSEPPDNDAASAPSIGVPMHDLNAEIIRLSRLAPLRYGQARKKASKDLGIPLKILDHEVSKLRRAPAITTSTSCNLILGDNGAPQPIFTNAAEVIRACPTEWPLAFDEFSQRPFLADVPLENIHLQKISEWVQRQGVLASRQVIDDAALYVAGLNKFHEVRDWLETLEWDQIPRINQVLIDHADAEDTPLVRVFSERWIIQAVARIYSPGCQADATLVLEGTQDLGKSSFFRAMFGDRWFADSIPSLESKDAQIQLLGIWCIEVSELAAFNKVENAKIKQFLTSRDDRFRLPWDRLAAQHPRQSVFGATVNPGAGGYLKDETGGRRFWPIAVSRMDTAAIYAARPQLWAEAVAKYKNKIRWHITEPDLLKSAKEAQGLRYVGDPWMEAIGRYLEGKDWVLLSDIFVSGLNITSTADHDQRSMNRIVACLGHYNWIRHQKRISGKPKWGYSPDPKIERVVTTEPEFPDL